LGRIAGDLHALIRGSNRAEEGAPMTVRNSRPFDLGQPARITTPWDTTMGVAR
jgi:hypothetical protein